MIGFTFGGTDLQAGDFNVSDTNAFGAPERELKIIELARRDGTIEVFDRFKDREIELSGHIVTADSPSLRAAIDTLKGMLTMGRRQLRVTDIDSAYREWHAKLRNLNIARGPGDVSFATFSMVFHSEDPFATSGDIDTLLTETNTLGSYARGITSLGTYPAYPDIVLTFNSIAPTNSAIEIVVGNPATNQFITIVRTIAATDTITIDSFNRQVFHNSTLISPEGQFPVWIPGSGTFEYSDNATSRNVSIALTNERRHL